jgi:uncharacterized cupredoxin-like copper-binding protein
MVVVAAAATACAPASAQPSVRTVHITIHFSSFDPGAIEVRPGEVVRFEIENTDPIDHEFIVGDAGIQRIHEEGTEAHHAPRPGEVSVPAGTTVVTVYAFPERPGTLLFGCHLPGHYAYGMRGTVTIG